MEPDWQKANLQFQAVPTDGLGKGKQATQGTGSIHLCLWEAKSSPCWRRSRQLSKMGGFQDDSEHLLSAYFVPGIALSVQHILPHVIQQTILQIIKLRLRTVLLLA